MKQVKLLLFFLPLCVFSQIPPDYYQGTALLSGYALKSKLHDIVSSKTITWNYGDLPDFYGQTDLDQHYDFDETNSIYLLDIYSNNPTGTTAYHYTKEQLISSSAVEGLGYNREHMMPQSSFNSNYPMYSDLFFVIPTDARINQRRSNYPYGIGGATNYHTFTNGSKISNNATPNSPYTGRVYEPHPEFKGDIARSLLYYVVRYEGKLNSFNYNNGTSPANDTSPLDGTEEKAFEDWYIDLLLQWHMQDPVSPREIVRNENVYILQKNRNPFIDHPEWVNIIWSQNPATIDPQAPTDISISRTSAYFVTLNWSNLSDLNLLGYKIYQNGLYIGYTKSNSITIDHLSPSTLYQYAVKAYYRDYTESSQSDIVEITTLDSDIYAKDLQITKYIEGTENNKALEITNRTGHAVDLNKYRLSVQFYNSTAGNYYFPAPFELEGVVQNNETFVVLNPKGSLDCIANDEVKFLSAAPQMNFDGGNYLELRYRSKTIDAIGFRDMNNFLIMSDVSLYRLPVATEPTSSFNLSEWQSFPTDYCRDLGVLGIDDFNNTSRGEVSVYPNPVTGNTLYLKGKNLKKIPAITIYDISGKQILTLSNPFVSKNEIDVQKIASGVYFLRFGDRSVKFIKR